MQGGNNGSMVIPFSSQLSPLFQFINTYPELGLTLKPTMPLNGQALSKDDVNMIKSWIDSGCKSLEGEIPFEKNYTTRSKIYMSNQGCDLVAIIDPPTGLIMRYIKVGHEENEIELPHNIQVSHDGRYWYACFVNGKYLQKYDAATDTLVAEATIGTGSWNVIRISENDQHGFVSDLSSNGKMVMVNLNSMSVEAVLSGSGVLSNPHGMAISKNADTIYITSQYGNMVYRYLPLTTSLDKISLQKGVQPVTTPQLLDPHEIMFSSDASKYFVTCQASNEVRVMDRQADTLLKVISVGKYPLEMAQYKQLLFVTCQEDINPVNNFFRGSVYVINTQTMQTEKIIYGKMFQPHGLAVDIEHEQLYIASRNADPTGPAPHHISDCGGRNGYFTILNLNNYEITISSNEASVDPYSLAYKP